MVKYKNKYYLIKDYILFSKFRSFFSLLSLFFQNLYFKLQKTLSIKEYILKLNELISSNMEPPKTDITIWYMNISSHLVKPSLFAIVGVFIMKLCELVGADVNYIHCKSGFDYCHSGANPTNPRKKMPCYSCVKFNETLYSGSSKLVFNNNFNKTYLSESIQLEKLINYKYKNLNVGKICLPSIKSILRTSEISDKDDGIHHLKKAIESSITFIDWLDYEYSLNKPEKIVVFNGLNFNEAILREWGLDKKISVITFENGKRESTVEFSNKIAVVSGFEFRDRKLDLKEEEKIKSFMNNRMVASSSPGNFISWENNGTHVFQKKIDKYKFVVSIFPNLSWDTAQAQSYDIFDSMWDWLDSLISIIKKNKDILFVIRAHPAEAYVIKRTFNSTKEWFYRNSLNNYPNVSLIDADTPFNSYELINISNFCLVSNSTIGLEAQYLETPTLASSWSAYSEFDLVTKPESLNEYNEILNDWVSGNINNLSKYNYDKLNSYLYQYFFETEFSFDDYIENYQSNHYAFKNRSIVNFRTINNYENILKGIISNGSFKNNE